MSKISTPYLKSISKDIHLYTFKIATKWVKLENVKSVFEAKSISTKKFRDTYAIAIIKYFIDVINDKQPIGNCPVMSKLVHYFLQKGITPREVFDICMGFRYILISFLLYKDDILQDIKHYMYEISQVFDANLSGVLEIFTNVYASTQKNLEIIKAQKHKLQQTLKIMNFIDTKLMIIQNTRIILANKPLLNILDVNDLKSLYIKYPNGFDFFNNIDTYSDIFKKDIKIWLEKIYTENKTFKINIFDTNKKQQLYFLGRITNMPAENNQYVITLSDITQEIKNEAIFKDTITHDELTGFRNYPTFENLLVSTIQKSKKSKKRIFLAVADIVELREINEKHSRDKGDMVISEVAEDLRYLVNKNISLGRLEGSRFGILLEYPTEQSAYDWCVELLKKMNQREERKTLAITEIDLSESVNKLFLRVYNLLESCNNSDDIYVSSDFKNIIEYKELPEQKAFIDKITQLKMIKTSIFYKQLAISYNSDILNISKEYVEITLSSKQIKVSKNNTEIYFKLFSIGNIKASILKLDKVKSIASINQFRFDKHSPLNRKKFRIEASKDIKAYISDDDRDFDIEVLDMNDEYIAIKIDRIRNFDINSLIYIDMLLPISNEFESCSTNATITRIEKISNGYKIVLLCHFNKKNKEKFQRYISENQMKIIHIFQNN